MDKLKERDWGGNGEESCDGVLCYAMNLANFFLVLVHQSQEAPSMKEDG